MTILDVWESRVMLPVRVGAFHEGPLKPVEID